GGLLEALRRHWQAGFRDLGYRRRRDSPCEERARCGIGIQIGDTQQPERQSALGPTANCQPKCDPVGCATEAPRGATATRQDRPLSCLDWYGENTAAGGRGRGLPSSRSSFRVTYRFFVQWWP